MAEDATGTTQADSGKPNNGDLNAKGTTPAGTDNGAGGQPGATEQTTQSSGTVTVKAEEESFFDPKDLTPELMPAYKNMQKAFGKKMEEIKANKKKIDAYDQFSKDPVTQLQTMASQMGYKLTRAEAAAAVEAGDGKAASAGEWQPQTWNDVFEKATEVIMQKLNPVLADVQATKKMNVEKLLDDSCPDWRQYEDEMTSLLADHPTLAKDPVKLYRLALPTEVLETRATQAALKKLQGKVDASKVGGTSTAKASDVSLPDKPVSFNEAVEAAKKSLAAQGMRAPR
jgi:hypothetical protein